MQAGGAEEYSQIRNEMTYGFYAVQTLFVGAFAAFFAAVAAAATLYGGDKLPLEWQTWIPPAITVLLSLIVTIAVGLSAAWAKISLRAGSYLLVFHERPNDKDVPEQAELGWMTRQRAETTKAGTFGTPRFVITLGSAYGALAILGLIPGGLIVWSGNCKVLLVLLVLSALPLGIAFWQLRSISNYRKTTVATWEAFRKDEEKRRAQ